MEERTRLDQLVFSSLCYFVARGPAQNQYGQRVHSLESQQTVFITLLLANRGRGIVIHNGYERHGRITRWLIPLIDYNVRRTAHALP